MIEYPLLVLESATASGSIALFRDAHAVASVSVKMGAAREDPVAPAVSTLIAESGIAASAIRSVLCGAGPGSFTSLRIAAAVGKGIAWANKSTLYAVPSLLLAAASIGKEGRYLVHSDAMRGERYALPVDIDSSGEVQSAGGLLRAATAQLADYAEKRQLVSVDDIAIDAANALSISEWQLQPVSLAGWEPDYGRLAEAQVKWEVDHGIPLGVPLGIRLPTVTRD